MAKLKNVVRHLSHKNYEAIHDTLHQTGAEKSAILFHHLRDDKLSDDDIMAILEVNSNAYYTLRSRLNQKIEEYLIEQMATPRTNLIKQVSNIRDIVFYKKRTIAVTALRKLEKELVDYDLSNELTVVYKVLKQLHINSPEHFTYSQQYNRHVAYMLATDKVEGLLAEYFKKFGEYFWDNRKLNSICRSFMTKYAVSADFMSRTDCMFTKAV